MNNRNENPILDIYCHRNKHLVIAFESGDIDIVDLHTGSKKQFKIQTPNYYAIVNNKDIIDRIDRIIIEKMDATVFIKELSHDKLIIAYCCYSNKHWDISKGDVRSIITIFDLEEDKVLDLVKLKNRIEIWDLLSLENSECLIRTQFGFSVLALEENNRLVERMSPRYILPPSGIHHFLDLPNHQILTSGGGAKHGDKIKVCSLIDTSSLVEIPLENTRQDSLYVKKFIKLMDNKVAVLILHLNCKRHIQENYIHIFDLTTQSFCEKFQITCSQDHASRKFMLAFIYNQFLVVRGGGYKEKGYFFKKEEYYENMIEIFDVTVIPCKRIKKIFIKEDGKITPMSDGRLAICNRDGKISLHNLLPIREKYCQKIEDFFATKSGKTFPREVINIVSQYAGFFSKPSPCVFTVKEKDSEKIAQVSYLDRSI